MTNKTKAKLPDIELATKEYVLMELKDTESRIEKAFHTQTQYLTAQMDRHRSEMAAGFKWLAGIGVAIVLAVLIQSILG